MAGSNLAKRCAWLVLAVVSLLPAATFGDVLVSNLGEPYRASTPIGNTPPDQYWATQSFVTDAHSYDLDSIQAIMGNAEGSPTGIFELRRDTGANEIDFSAGGLLTSFTAPALNGANSVRDFFPIAGTQLAPGTKYWFVVGVNDTGSFEWDYANTGFFDGPGALTEFGDSADGGVTWNYHDSPFFPYFLQVTATRSSIPEPAMGTLLAMVGLLWTTGRRRALKSNF